MQAYEGAAQIVLAGTDSVLRAMESYTKQAWVLRAWQDVFVDLVQGQLQHLYTSLLSSEPLAPLMFGGLLHALGAFSYRDLLGTV